MNRKGEVLNDFIMFLVGCSVGLLLAMIGMGGEYKQGQIDCIEGKIKYKQVETKTWKEIE